MNDDHNPSEGEDHASDDEIDPVADKGEPKLPDRAIDPIQAKGKSKLCDRKQLYQELDSLIIEACQHSPDSFARRRLLSKIVIKMKNSGLIWQNHRNESFYEDAVQEQWCFFTNNLCESRTGTAYDRTRSNPITWFNNSLQWRFLTLTMKIAEENNRTFNHEIMSEDGNIINVIEELPDRDDSRILEYIRDFQEVQQWIETNPDGVLSEHIRGRPELTCQVILRSLSSGKNFPTIALELGCPYPTIYSFYKKKCHPHLQVFRENHGY
ncbi:hypothetical protein [Tychonema sp. BBK16]|uniref:hypothetical protein n=1 Tax=Tychonema sp. BBK16 TaxID=2699888 RepID=UPI001F276462|nr:hypothetical protein [Tychonema sp. BBK16]MCF6373203.1 hypothetical protein [Tychonema sp. BBK16]